jgi:hypothetical protein
VDFNLFSGYMVVHLILVARGGQGRFKWARAPLEIALRPIFKKHFRANDISVTNASLCVVQESNGALYVGGFRIKSAKGAAGQKHARGSRRENGWEIGFGNIDLKNVTVHFKAPGFERQMLFRQAHIDSMQTWNPSSAGGFSAELAIGDGSIHIQGMAKPYSRETFVRGRLQIRKLPLAWAEPWLKKRAIHDIGGTLEADSAFSILVDNQTQALLKGTLSLHQLKTDLIESGQLCADFHLLVEQDRMDSVIKLVIAELNLILLSQRQLGPMEHELGMPLNTALDLLRDRHGNIHLRLPFTGNWAKPYLQMGSVIAEAVRSATYNAIKAAALSYFAPLGAAFIAGKQFGKLVALRLNAIDFDAGQGQLDPTDKQYLDLVAAKLKDRP